MIGVFDSGSGGLTILRSLQTAMPDQDFLYYGDHKNAPYGHRSNEQIVELTRAGVDYLMDRGCTLVVLACNTAAAVALRTLQQNWLEHEYPGRRILGVLVPMVEAITGISWASETADPERSGEIVLFGTRKTVKSGAYREEIAKRAPNINLIEKACPGLVDAIEGGAGRQPLSGLINGFIEELGSIQPTTAILGCTHFPLVEEIFQSHLPASTSIVSQPNIVAASLEDYLRRHPELCKLGTGETRLLTTGDPDHTSDVSQQFFDGHLPFESA